MLSYMHTCQYCTRSIIVVDVHPCGIVAGGLTSSLMPQQTLRLISHRASTSCSKGQWNIQNAWKLLETSVGTWRLLLLLRFLLGMDGAFGFRACLFDSSDFGIGSRKPDQHLCACIFDTRVDHMSLHSSADGNYAQVLGAIPGVLLCICICCCICCLCGCWANWLGTGSKKDKDEDTPLLEKNEASTEK
jgi:hypothetical protein